MTASEPPPEPKLSWYAHAAAGWPLIMIFLGGAIGGACGGLAYGTSVALFKRKGQNIGTYLAAFAIGVLAICVYLGVVYLLMQQFPGLFKK